MRVDAASTHWMFRDFGMHNAGCLMRPESRNNTNVGSAVEVSGQACPETTREDEKLKEACRSFEAMLTGIMLKGMRKTVVKTDLFGSGKEEELFQEMLDSEICQSVSKSAAVGIAQMLYRQLRSDQAIAITDRATEQTSPRFVGDARDEGVT